MGGKQGGQQASGALMDEVRVVRTRDVAEISGDECMQNSFSGWGTGGAGWRCVPVLSKHFGSLTQLNMEQKWT